MGQRTTPQPNDARWTAPAINLLRTAVLLDLPYDMARAWAVGATKTAMGATIVVTSPLVPATPARHGEIDLPLVGLAGVVLLHALTTAGADPIVLADVVLAMQNDGGPDPLAAHRDVVATLPPALAAAATDRDEPSLLMPIVPAGGGWCFGPMVGTALGTFDHDADGWVRAVRLAWDVVVGAGSVHAPHVEGARAAVAVRSMFRAGSSIAAIAVVLDCPIEDVEAILRRQV